MAISSWAVGDTRLTDFIAANALLLAALSK
jgi:hypothetical protein